MKFKLIAALLGLLMAIPGAVIAQSSDDQTDQDVQVAPAPDDQNYPDQGPSNQGPSDQGSSSGQAPASQPASAPETSGVARVSLIHGDVSTQRGDTGTWSAAALNAPVLAGDRVSTGDKARAELQLDYANMFRLAEHSQANITNLSRSQIQIQLARGMANYSVFKDSEADAEIDTPNVAIHTNRRESSFRILVTTDDHTEVLVRKGEVEVTTPQGSTRVGQGQFITVQGSGEQEQYKIAEAPARDDWDQWNTDRDYLIRNSAARKHTNPYYVGTEDLDSHGQWKDVPDYGSVWVPTVDSDWAPYRSGHWVWEPGWGWTWVSYDPWGWAPYHYGRWMYYDNAWAWWPGPIYADPFYRPIWAPAYVSFFGFGGGFGFGFGGGFGSIGWFPIGPCDPFFPWWGGFGSRFNVVNITNINIINGRGGWRPLHGGMRFSNLHSIRDPHFRNALSTVRANEFGRGRLTAHPVTNEMFRNAQQVRGNLPVVPNRQSLNASGRPAAASTIPTRQNQRFFSNTRTPARAPQSFEREQARVQNNIRQNSRLTPITGNRSGAMESNPRFSQPARGAVNSTANGREAARPGGNSTNPGWRRFGQGGPGMAGSSNSALNRERPGTTSMGSRGSVPANNGGERRLAPPAASPAERGSTNPARGPEMRPDNRNSAPAREGNNSQWRRFTPEPRTAPQAPAGRSSSNDSWRGSARGSASPSPRVGRGDARPPLNMRQPIVTPRGGESYGRGSYGGPRGNPGGGYSAPSRGGYSAPSPSRGGYSAPSPSRGGYSAPSPRGGGGAPHSSGGGSTRGGSAPSHGGNGSGRH
jgi:FecR protein